MTVTKNRRRAAGSFFTALVLALCVLGLGGACLLIEYNIQRTAYGRVSFVYGYTLQGGEPVVTAGGNRLGLLPPATEQALRACVAPPVRLTAELLRRETAAFARLWARLLPTG